MPFLAVCPGCHYSQVCVLPESTFPRVKCCRCREVYDPVGSDDTEVIAELAGTDVARHIQERRAVRSQTGAMRARLAARPAGRKARATARELSPDDVAAAVLSAPEPGPATADGGIPAAADTEPQANSADTEPVTRPARAPSGPRTGRRARPAAPVATPLTAGALLVVGAGLATTPWHPGGEMVRLAALLGLLVGLAGVRVAAREGVTIRYAALVTVLAAAVLLASVLAPALVGLEAGCD